MTHSILADAVDRFFGTGRHAVTVPAMDGPLMANTALDEAALVANISAPDNLVAVGESIYFTGGSKVYALDECAQGRFREKLDVGSDVTALATDGHGRIAIASDPGKLQIVESSGGGVRDYTLPMECARGSITSAAFDGPDELLVCIGSKTNRHGEWARDLMERNASGAVLSLALSSGKWRYVIDNLAYPSGIFVQNGEMLVSEAWRHRIIKLPVHRSTKPQVVVWDLPAYPSRISESPGGYLLCLFAPRNQLVEFVLREKGYRRRMLSEVPSDLWVAPALKSRRSFHEPLQGGELKQLGILKPWAPSRSYGLVVRLDRDLQIVDSFHSRADGDRHGVTSAVASTNGSLLVTSRGGDAILRIDRRS